MRFPFPCFPAEFELPDDWLAEAGFVGFKPRAEAFRSTETATHAIPLRDIEPPFRYPEHPKDFRGFDRARMIKILAGIVDQLADGMVLKPAVKYQRVAQTMGIPRDNH